MKRTLISIINNIIEMVLFIVIVAGVIFAVYLGVAFIFWIITDPLNLIK